MSDISEIKNKLKLIGFNGIYPTFLGSVNKKNN